MRRVRLAIVWLLAFGVAPAFAFDNEPSGFRGVAWGAPLTAVRAKVDLTFNQQIEADIAEYRSSADLWVNGIPLRYNLYRFYKGRFFQGIMFADFQYRTGLEETLTARFGPPQDRAPRQVGWSGVKTVVILNCGAWEKACMASFQSAEITAEQIKDRAASAKSSKDF